MDEFPPGFRFYPTEEELVSFYLHNKLEGNGQDLNRVIPVVNVYELEPWHLPEVSGVLCHGDSEQWFFFVPRQEREARGGRPNRTTASGYWKATGSPNYVYSSDNRVIGVKKTMVFYKGKAPAGRKTKWKMNEYREIKLEEMENPHSGFIVPKLRHELSLCRVYVVSGSLRSFDRRPLGPETRDTGEVSGSLRSLDRRPLGPETRDTVVVPKANVMNLEVASPSQSTLRRENTSMSTSSLIGGELVDAIENV